MLEEGVFRGTVVTHGVGKTREKEYPQFILSVQPEEVYDFDEGKWGKITEMQAPVTGYLVLCTDTAEIFHLDDIRTTFEWTGTTFASLAEADYSGRKVQFVMKDGEGDYAGKIRMNGIRPWDAVPSGGIRTVDADELKAMDNRFGGFLKNSAGKAATKGKGKGASKKAAPTPPPAPPPAPPTPPAPPAEQPPQDTSAPDTAPVPPASPATPAPANKTEAWSQVIAAGSKANIPPEDINAWWVEACKATPDDWAAIASAVCQQINPDDIPF